MAETPDYTPPDSDRQGARRQRRFFVVALVLTPLLLVTGLFMASRGGDDDNASTEESTTSTIAAASPIDGKASKLLDVRVTPDVDLVDGQQVTVTGSGFPGPGPYAILMCTNQARQQGVNACDLSTSTGYSSGLGVMGSEGTFTETYVVRRFITIAGQTVDCATGNVDPAEYARLVEEEGRAGPVRADGFTCAIVAAMVDDYDQSGGWPIAFEGAELGLTASTPTTPVITSPPTGAPPPDVPDVVGENEVPLTTATGTEPTPPAGG
jgi:hypothetical protein